MIPSIDDGPGRLWQLLSFGGGPVEKLSGCDLCRCGRVAASLGENNWEDGGCLWWRRWCPLSLLGAAQPALLRPTVPSKT